MEAAALSVGQVQGASLDPGLAAELRHQAVVALRQRGVGAGGDTLVLRLEVGSESVAAVVPGSRAGALEGGLAVHAAIPSRPGCEVRVQAQRVWGVSGASAANTEVQRDRQRSELAGWLAERVVDAILGRPECRVES